MMVTYWEHLKSVLQHKHYVYRAGRMIGGIPLWRLITHDWSKFSPTEMRGYAGNKGGAVSKERWARAWIHHLSCNPHHPEHWLLSWRGNPDFYDGVGEFVADNVVVLPMPLTYVREMVADFMGSSKGYTGSYDIAPWINKEGKRMRLHTDTVTKLDRVLHEIGYHLTDDWSYVAGTKFLMMCGEE